MPSEHPFVTAWKTERREIIRRVAGDPSHAWFWQIRMRVLEYLISRYSGPHAFRLPAEEQLPSHRMDRRGHWANNASSISADDSARMRTLLTRIQSNVHSSSR